VTSVIEGRMDGAHSEVVFCWLPVAAAAAPAYDVGVRLTWGS
jgi:hypothetical protein